MHSVCSLVHGCHDLPLTVCVQFAKPKVSEQESALLALGAYHTASMSASIIVSLIALYTIFQGSEPGRIFGIVLATLAAWFCASLEARVRVQAGTAIGENKCQILSGCHAQQPSCPILLLCLRNHGKLCSDGTPVLSSPYLCLGGVLKDTIGSAVFGLFWLIFTVMMIALTNRLTDGRTA